MPSENRVALVTGAARGLGAAAARALAEAGARVVLVDIDPEAEAVAASLRAAGHEAAAVPGDVSRPPEADRLVSAALERFGRLDILVKTPAFAHAPRLTT